VHGRPWVAGYIGALVIWWLLLGAGKSPTLWRGRSLVFLNGAFIVASVVTMLIRQLRPSSALVGFDVILLGLVLLLRGVWLTLHVGMSEVERILEECFTRTRAVYARAGGDYVLTVADREMRVNLSVPIRGVIRIGFGGNRGSKKAQLIRALIAKQFRGSFPAVKIGS
jgi:hypothetical protein